MFGLHYIFNYLNSKKGYYLIRKWMTMSYEIPARNDEDYDVIGLSRKENKTFWLAEDRLNHRYLGLLVNACLVVIAIVFDSQLFFVSFDVGIAFYALMQTINVLWNTFGIFCYLHGFYTLSTFYITIILFMTRKLRYIRKQVQSIDNSLRTRQIDNRKLARLIHDCNFVRLELTEMNNLFK